MVSLFDWVFQWFSGLFGPRSGKILFLGLDNAGKTTLLNLLKNDRLSNFPPTIHPTSNEISIGNVRLITFDLGGHLQARRTWKEYSFKVDGVVYMIDAVEKNRFMESRKELYGLFEFEELDKVPFLILGNKIDRPNVASEHEIREKFGLRNTTEGYDADVNTRPVGLFMCSLVSKCGYGDGLLWLVRQIKKRN